MTDLTIRPLQPGEDHLLLAMPETGYAKTPPLAERYPELIGKREYRPEWTWIALRGGRVAARAIWWGGPDDAAPRTLTVFDFENPDDGSALLRAAPFRTEYMPSTRASTVTPMASRKTRTSTTQSRVARPSRRTGPGSGSLTVLARSRLRYSRPAGFVMIRGYGRSRACGIEPK